MKILVRALARLGAVLARSELAEARRRAHAAEADLELLRRQIAAEDRDTCEPKEIRP